MKRNTYIIDVEPHKRTILDCNKKTYFLEIPKSIILVKGNSVYYGIKKLNYLIGTNLMPTIAVNCGSWIDKIDKTDKSQLLNAFWQSRFEIQHSIYHGAVSINGYSGLIDLNTYQEVNLLNLSQDDFDEIFIEMGIINQLYFCAVCGRLNLLKNKLTFFSNDTFNCLQDILSLAAFSGSFNIVKFAFEEISKLKNINDISKEKAYNYALINTLHGGHINIFKYLLPFIKTTSLSQVFMDAVEANNFEIIQLLLNQKHNKTMFLYSAAIRQALLQNNNMLAIYLKNRSYFDKHERRNARQSD